MNSGDFSYPPIRLLSRPGVAASLIISLVAATQSMAGEPTSDPSPVLLLHWNSSNNQLEGAASRGAKAVRCQCNANKSQSDPAACPASLCGASVVVEGGVVAKTICQAVAKSHEFSLLAVVSRAKAEQHGPARIVSFSSDTSARNFTLGQEGAGFNLRVLTRDSDANGSQKDSHFGKVASDQSVEVLVACRDQSATCYVDGKLVKKIALAGAIDGWSDRHKIVFGDELTGERDWSGRLHQVTIFDRALKPPEARLLVAGKGGSGKKSPSKRSPAKVDTVPAKPGAEVKVTDRADADVQTKPQAAALRRRMVIAEAKAKMEAHEKAHGQSAEFDKQQAAALSGLRADVSSLQAELEALRRDGRVLAGQLAASEKHRQQVQRELAELLKQRDAGPSDVVEVSKQFAAALKQLNESSQARLIEQQRSFEAEAQRFRSEHERTRAEVQRMHQQFEKQIGELKKALEAAHRAKAHAEAEAKAAHAEARAAEQRATKKEPEPVAEKVPGADESLRLSVLHYHKNIAVAESDQRRALEEVKKILARDSKARFEIVGHTCTDGRSQVNRYLSNLRASNVRDYLVAHGVPVEALDFRGVGETQPMADNATPEGRQLNRRVEILRKQ